MRCIQVCCVDQAASRPLTTHKTWVQQQQPACFVPLKQDPTDPSIMDTGPVSPPPPPAYDPGKAVSIPEQLNVEVQVAGAQLLTTLVSMPSCVSVAVAPSSQGAAVVGGTPGAQAV